MEGVQSVKVSLKEGVATIRFAPSNRVTIERIREAVRSNGFTAREAEARVAGSVVLRGDTLMLVTPGADTFVLRDAPGSVGIVADVQHRALNRRVVLAGQIPAKRERREQELLLVRSFALEIEHQR